MDQAEISARLEINQALIRYCRGVDRGDPALIGAAFHPGAEDEHGPFRGLGSELAERLAYGPHDPDAGGQHQLFNVYIELDGPDLARVESYVMAYHPVCEPDGSEKMLVFAGRYLDRFERRDGEWKIAHRQVICDWHRKEELSPPMPQYPPGRKGPGRDPAYGMFPALS
jgi:hypothetical protein